MSSKRKASPLAKQKKKRKYASHFQSDWEQEFQWVSKSGQCTTKAYCKLCSFHLSVAHGGKNDLVKHSNTTQHISLSKTSDSTKKITSFITTDKNIDSVISIEIQFANFFAEHNIPFSVADHLSKLIKKSFPGCNLARKYGCGKTKTTMIVKKAIAPEITRKVQEICRQQPFSLLIDESNDKNTNKSLVILVRVFDSAIGKAVTRFLDLPVCNISTAEAIFSHVDKSLREAGIPWENLIAFTSDNCNVMMGKKNSVSTRIKSKQPNAFDFGCVCHLANLCATHAIKGLPMSIDEFLIDIYYHFQYSAKRREEYKSFMEFCDVEPSKLLKYAATRWLSLEKCVGRVLEHWPSLLSYFASHADNEKDGRIKRAKENFENKAMQVYFLFLQYILHPLNEFNTAFQAESSKMGNVHGDIKRLLRKFMAKFVKAKSIASESDLTKVQYKESEHQLDDSLIAVGLKTRTFLVDNEDDMSPAIVKRIMKSVRVFYENVVEKMIKKFPFNEPVFKHMTFLQPARKLELTAQSVISLGERFPQLVAKKDFNTLEDQFLEFQITPPEELPACETIDGFWSDMDKLMIFSNGQKRFDILCNLAKGLLTIPNSNAPCERVFSMVRKIQTDYRTDLDNDTIVSLLSCKMNIDEDCVNFSPSATMLKEAKSCTYNYNKEHM